MAANILGKRVAISSEASIRAKDSERFRSLVSGEELRVKNLYKNEITTPHNAFFVSATNKVGWIEDCPENRKRVRVVNWDNSIPVDEMDEKLLEKLKCEIPGIIVKCLKKFFARSIQRIAPTSSTDKFMSAAGRQVNPVFQWVHDEQISKGTFFQPTENLWIRYKIDTGHNITKTHFGRLIGPILGDESKDNRGIVNGEEKRGYFINKENVRIDMHYGSSSDLYKTSGQSPGGLDENEKEEVEP